MAPKEIEITAEGHPVERGDAMPIWGSNRLPIKQLRTAKRQARMWDGESIDPDMSLILKTWPSIPKPLLPQSAASAAPGPEKYNTSSMNRFSRFAYFQKVQC